MSATTTPEVEKQKGKWISVKVPNPLHSSFSTLAKKENRSIKRQLIQAIENAVRGR